MPFNLLPLNFAIICEGNELETYDVVQEGPNSTRAFVASEAGKQFHITFRNDMFDMDIVVNMYIDGERIYHGYLRAGLVGQVLGVRKTSTSVLPFKFQELELVDLEYAPVVPEMGTIELRAFRCQALRTVQYQGIPGYGLHEGRVSERSKKAGWHHVSTADEIASAGPTCSVYADYFDPQDSPYVNLKVFYRPRELLMAQGVITGHNVGARNSGEYDINNRKRAREDGSAGPSKRPSGSTVKKEEISANARQQRIQALQAELNSLTAGPSGSSVKRELRSPSPIVVGQAAGEVVDLTLDDD
ncbi:hypothetical protein DFH94DRAFT_690107 [Russula ochroleuca]|uniref:DUF7918 domain-containing protein n=1 Tax=Russula ochroleuca TaxID=152965 RepID=A0A9P5N0V4_9AGAM|nr:hypothetical protein DFH94DRAFT_690107 [Russula ochroleuca]